MNGTIFGFSAANIVTQMGSNRWLKPTVRNGDERCRSAALAGTEFEAQAAAPEEKRQRVSFSSVVLKVEDGLGFLRGKHQKHHRKCIKHVQHYNILDA